MIYDFKPTTFYFYIKRLYRSCMSQFHTPFVTFSYYSMR